MAIFDIRTPWSPTADQPKAIAKLFDGLQKGLRYQTLLGATGTGNHDRGKCDRPISKANFGTCP
jgi:excinuclease UvrABC helicase subunit UvrB